MSTPPTLIYFQICPIELLPLTLFFRLSLLSLRRIPFFGWSIPEDDSFVLFSSVWPSFEYEVIDPLPVRAGSRPNHLRHTATSTFTQVSLLSSFKPNLLESSAIMTNFFEEAAFALLDPTSLSVHQSSSSFSTSFHSFSSLSDIDVSALGLGLNESRERQIKSSESLDASPSLCPQDDSFHSDNSSVDFYSFATSRIRENVGSSSPSDSLSPLLNTTSLASAYCSGPAATTSNSYHFNLPPSVVNAGGHHPSSNGYQSFLYMDGGIHYGNAPYSQPALSHKTSVESFASSTSDVLQTPRSTWCHPWDELSMPSGHQFIPGQSPAPPPLSHPSSSRSRAGSPRRDRVLSLKSSMPSLVEEEVYHPSQGMGTLPECQTGDRGDEVFFFAVGPDDYPSEETSQGSLLPAAAVTGHGNRGYHVQAPTFASQATFEQVANDYLVDGSDGRQHWTSQHPGHSVLVGSALNPNAYVISDDPDGLRPLTAPESGSEEGISATATAVMRK